MKRRSCASTLRPCCAGCFWNVRNDPRSPCVLDDLLDDDDAEGADQLVLQVGLADVEPEPLHAGPREVDAASGARQPAPERALLGGIAQPGQLDVQPRGPEDGQEAPDRRRPTDRHDGDALGAEVATTAPRQRFQRHLVADPLDEHDRAGVDPGCQQVGGRDDDRRALSRPPPTRRRRSGAGAARPRPGASHLRGDVVPPDSEPPGARLARAGLRRIAAALEPRPCSRSSWS